MIHEAEIFCPKDQTDWRKWLEKHHLQKESVWLVMYKKDASKTNLSWSEAVDEALCFGWIDSLKKPVDEEKFKQYFTKRKPTSTWSKINKNKISELTETGRMTEAGIASVNLAKKNGTWTRMDGVENLRIPTDLNRAFRQVPGSKPYFNSLSKSMRKQLLFWVASAKRPETKEKRISDIVTAAGKNSTPKQFQ